MPARKPGQPKRFLRKENGKWLLNPEYARWYRETHREKVRADLKRWHQQNKQRRNRTRTERYLKLRQEILTILGNRCIRCGETDWRCLQIDHVHGGGRKEYMNTHVDAYLKTTLEKLRAGSKEYQCLCANCNWKKRYEEKEFQQANQA